MRMRVSVPVLVRRCMSRLSVGADVPVRSARMPGVVAHMRIPMTDVAVRSRGVTGAVTHMRITVTDVTVRVNVTGPRVVRSHLAGERGEKDPDDR